MLAHEGHGRSDRGFGEQRSKDALSSCYLERTIAGHGGDRPLDYCPFIQASSQFFRGAFDIEWKEPVVNCEIDPDAFRKEHVSFARSLGFSHHKACLAFNTALEHLEEFQASLRSRRGTFCELSRENGAGNSCAR